VTYSNETAGNGTMEKIHLTMKRTISLSFSSGRTRDGMQGFIEMLS